MATRSIVVYVVNCGRCGQTWERTHASDAQALECVFCGGQGRLRLMDLPSESSHQSSSARIEARLECRDA